MLAKISTFFYSSFFFFKKSPNEPIRFRQTVKRPALFITAIIPPLLWAIPVRTRQVRHRCAEYVLIVFLFFFFLHLPPSQSVFRDAPRQPIKSMQLPASVHATRCHPRRTAASIWKIMNSWFGAEVNPSSGVATEATRERKREGGGEDLRSSEDRTSGVFGNNNKAPLTAVLANATCVFHRIKHSPGVCGDEPPSSWTELP